MILSPLPVQKFFSNLGLPLVGGKLFTYAAGTNTKIATYQSSSGTLNTNPIVLNFRGEANVWLDPELTYKFVLAGPLDSDPPTNPIWSVDNIAAGLTIGELTQQFIGQRLWPRTASETAAGVTPTNYAYEPGDIRRYGAIAGGSAADNRVAIQNALDSNSGIWIPDGTFDVNATLRWNDGQELLFQSRNAILKANITAAILKGKNAETTRRFNLQIYSGTIDGTSRANVGSIALDMFAATGCKVFGTLIRNVETAVRQDGSGSLGCFYNGYHDVDISTVVTGYSNGTLGNENKVIAGRVNDCTTGTIDNDNSCNSYYGLAIEVFGTGHRVGNTAASLLTRFVGSRLENLPTSGIAIDVGANAQDTFIECPYLVGVTTEINNAGMRTTILMPRGGASTPQLLFNDGTGIKAHFHATVTRDVASFAPGEFRQEGPITVTGMRLGDAVSVALPAAWPTNLMVGVPIVTGIDTVYLPMYNPSAGAVDPASGDFQFDCWRH